MVEWLLDPLNRNFMQQALAVGLLVGILCPVIGSYLIVQRMALLGNVISHAVLPGLAIANFLGIDLLLGAFAFGLLSTGLIAWIGNQSRLKADSAMALTLASFFALGVVLIGQLRSKLDLEGLLFGNILTVTMTDVWRAGAIAAVILILVIAFYKELLFYTFDPTGAEVVGLPTRVIQFCLTAAIALTIVLGMKTVGVILVVSLLVGPASTAYLLVKELHQMMALGAVLGSIASIAGMYLSYYYEVASGPAIALVVFALFLLALLFSPSEGVLTQRFRFRRSIESR